MLINTGKFLLAFILALLTAVSVFAQNIVVSGTVTDEDGLPVEGATVYDKADVRNGTSTDSDGFFRLTVRKNSILTVSCIGYKDYAYQVTGQQTIKVMLEFDNSQLDEAVVIGYGSVTKRDLTGAVGRANIDAIQTTNAVSLSDGLGGRIAGLNIITPDGAPGSEACPTRGWARR